MNEIQIGYRKIQRLREAHYINLPKIWMLNNRAKQGDCLQVRLEPDGSLNISVAPVTACKHATDAASTTGRSASMNNITTKINKANGRILGFSIFLNGDVVEALGVQGDALTLNVRAENGEIILLPL